MGTNFILRALGENRLEPKEKKSRVDGRDDTEISSRSQKIAFHLTENAGHNRGVQRKKLKKLKRIIQNSWFMILIDFQLLEAKK